MTVDRSTVRIALVERLRTAASSLGEADEAGHRAGLQVEPGAALVDGVVELAEHLEVERAEDFDHRDHRARRKVSVRIGAEACRDRLQFRVQRRRDWRELGGSPSTRKDT